MNLEELIQYASIASAIFFLIVKRDGMKKYIPVAMFASLYANIWCYIAKHYNFWSFPSRLFPIAEDISIPVNMLIVPIIAMFWVRYCPPQTIKKFFWALGWTTVLVLIEFSIGKYTNLIEYYNGYKWYHSYILWFFSFYIWLSFDIWLKK